VDQAIQFVGGGAHLHTFGALIQALPSQSSGYSHALDLLVVQDLDLGSPQSLLGKGSSSGMIGVVWTLNGLRNGSFGSLGEWTQFAGETELRPGIVGPILPRGIRRPG